MKRLMKFSGVCVDRVVPDDQVLQSPTVYRAVGSLSTFIEGEMERAEAGVAATPPEPDVRGDLDSVFRQILAEAWEPTA